MCQKVKGSEYFPNALYTGVAYQDNIESPEWPSYSFDLNRLENLWQYLIMAVY